jgi:hypothetical protein
VYTLISPPPQARKKAKMFCPSPRDLTISPNVAPITRVTRYPDTNGVVTMNKSVGGLNGSGVVSDGFIRDHPILRMTLAIYIFHDEGYKVLNEGKKVASTPAAGDASRSTSRLEDEGKGRRRDDLRNGRS